MKIDHIGIATHKLDDALALWRDALGLQVDFTGEVNEQGVRVAMLPVGDTHVELLEPLSDSSPVGKFLEKRGPGIHHICFAVENLDDTLARCRDKGVRLIDDTPRIGAEGKRIAFLHPASTGGVLIELTED